MALGGGSALDAAKGAIKGILDKAVAKEKLSAADAQATLDRIQLAAAIKDQIDRWKEKGGWQKIQVCELLFVRGWANQDVATELGITEQAVANIKFDFLARLRKTIREQNLNEDVFPELYQ